jgi:hypothetical protein
MRLARDARESAASGLDVMRSVVNEVHRGIESWDRIVSDGADDVVNSGKHIVVADWAVPP